jgi:hypothetical protein
MLYFIMSVSKCRHIEILEWLKYSGHEFKHTEEVINWALCYGHVEILEWFKKSNYKFKYNKWAFVPAFEYRYVKILKMVKKS